MQPSAAPDKDQHAQAGAEARSEPRHDYDVVVIGGALAGSSCGTLLRRWLPGRKILIVEPHETFPRKVGEATVEVSAYFLKQVLGLYNHLSLHHLPKHGLRFWTSDRPDRELREMSEVGPASAPRLPAFQLDRARLDEHVLSEAEGVGCEVLRPAKVLAVEEGWPVSRVRIEAGGEIREVSARWVIDASGRHAFLARRKRLHERVENHATAAVWARWVGVADLDGTALRGEDPRCPALPPVAASRRLATNHFSGYGWWCWVIPLGGGDTSVGLVYDKALFELPGSGERGARYEDFVTSQPGLRELLEGACRDREDTHAYSHLAYKTRQYMGRGWALVGDAASFIDPFYSPGLDHLAISVYATARLVEEDLRGRLEDDAALDAEIAEHNARFLRSYDRWLEALYLGKYELMGDAELIASAFLVDTSLYYLGVVTPVYREIEALRNPVFGPPLRQATIAYRVMKTFNRRLNRLARFRRQAGTYGRRNAGWNLVSRDLGLGREAIPMLRQGLGIWLRAEGELLRYRLRHWRRLELSRPVTLQASRG